MEGQWSREVAARGGQSLLVVNPSSTTLTIGLASQSTPFSVPHVVAYATTADNQSLGCNASSDVLKKTADESNHTPVHERRKELDRQAALQEALSALNIPDDGDHWRAGPLHNTVARGRLDKTREKILVGQDALEVGSLGGYKLVYPIVSGQLNPSRSRADLLRDLGNIWGKTLESIVGIPQNKFKDLSLVLVIPDDAFGIEVEVLVDVGFRELGFVDVLVHTESIAASFGEGCSSACIVNLGSQGTSVCCVEDGMLVPRSRIQTNFGGNSVCRILLWLLQTRGGWTNTDMHSWGFNPEDKPFAQQQAMKMVSQGCFLPAEGHSPQVLQQIQACPPLNLHLLSNNGDVSDFHVCLGATACVAPMGYFFPFMAQACVPSQTAHMSKSSPVESHLWDLSMGEGFKGSTSSCNVPDGIVSIETLSESIFSRLQGESDLIHPLPLDVAIVQSILSVPRPEHRKKFFTSIVLAGEFANLRGLADMLERHVLFALPNDELAETVAVLESKGDPIHSLWKGGVLLGLLESGDHRVGRQEWIHGGVSVGEALKFGRSDSSISRVFWYFRAQQGLLF